MSESLAISGNYVDKSNISAVLHELECCGLKDPSSAQLRESLALQHHAQSLQSPARSSKAVFEVRMGADQGLTRSAASSSDGVGEPAAENGASFLSLLCADFDDD